MYEDVMTYYVLHGYCTTCRTCKMLYHINVLRQIPCIVKSLLGNEPDSDSDSDTSLL